MKTVITLFMSMLAAVNTYGQTAFSDGYHPMAVDNKVWEYTTADNKTVSFYTAGDTLISGKTYKKIMKHDENSEQDHYMGALRDDENRCVWLMQIDSVRERVAFNFGALSSEGSYIDASGRKVKLAHRYVTKSHAGKAFWSYGVEISTPGQTTVPKGGPIWIEGVGPVFDQILGIPTAGNGDFSKCYVNGECILDYSNYTMDIFASYNFPTGTTWTQSVARKDGTNEDLYYATVGKDTLINETPYRKIEVKSLAEGEFNGSPCAIREDEYSKLYVYFYDQQQEVLYYDSKWSEGKDVAYMMFDEGMARYFKAQDIKTMKLDDGREYQYFDAGGTRIIHSIGKVTGFSGLFGYEFLEPDDGATYYMSSFTRKGAVIYKNEVHLVDPYAGISANEVLASRRDDLVVDLQGRRLKQKPAKGIYIKNGRKMIIR